MLNSASASEAVALHVLSELKRLENIVLDGLLNDKAICPENLPNYDVRSEYGVKADNVRLRADMRELEQQVTAKNEETVTLRIRNSEIEACAVESRTKNNLLNEQVVGLTRQVAAEAAESLKLKESVVKLRTHVSHAAMNLAQQTGALRQPSGRPKAAGRPESRHRRPSGHTARSPTVCAAVRPALRLKLLPSGLARR
jgi:hypothetical protein